MSSRTLSWFSLGCLLTGLFLTSPVAAAATQAPSSVGNYAHPLPRDPAALAAAKINAAARQATVPADTWRAALARKGSKTPAAPQTSSTSAAPAIRSATNATTLNSTIGQLSYSGLAAASPGQPDNVSPPDVTGAAGATHYVEIVNSLVQAYRKSDGGAAGSPVALPAFNGAAAGDSVHQAQVQFDPISSQWFEVALETNASGTANFLDFAWTLADNPTGTWCTAKYPTATLRFDFPMLGHDITWLMVGANIFDMAGGSPVFRTASVLTFAKAGFGGSACPAGLPAAHQTGTIAAPLLNADATPTFTPVPTNTWRGSDNATGSGNGYVIAAHDPTTGAGGQATALDYWSVTAGGTLSAATAVAVNPYSIPSNMPQPRSKQTLDTLDARLTNAVAMPDPANGNQVAIWTQHAVLDVGSPSVARYYEIVPANTGSPVARSGNAYADQWTFNAAISPTTAGNEAVLVASGGSGTNYAQSMAASLEPGTVGSGFGNFFQAQVQSPGGQDDDYSCTPVCAWGRHAAAAPDPGDPHRAWGSGEVSQSSSANLGPANWTTWNYSISALQEVASFPLLANGQNGYQSVLELMNAGSGPAGIKVLYFDAAGTQAGPGEFADQVPSNANVAFSQNDGNAFPTGGGGSARVYSDQPVSGFANLFNGARDATAYDAFVCSSSLASCGSQQMNAPALASNSYGGYNTTIYVTNLDPLMAGGITVTYYGTGGGTPAATETCPSLPAHGQLTIPTNTLAAGCTGTVPAPAVDGSGFTGVVTSSSAGFGPPQIAMVVTETGPPSDPNLLSSYDGVPYGSTQQFAPVMLNNAYGGYFTGVGIANTQPTGGSVTITYYDPSGTSVKSVTKAIAGNGYLGVYQGDPSDGPPSSTSGYTAVISSSVAVAMEVNELSSPPSQPASFTAYNTESTTFSTALGFALVENAVPDNGSTFTTGLGIMNPSSSPSTLTLQYYDASSGAPIACPMPSLCTTTLNPYAFWSAYQGDPNVGIPAGTRATLVVSAGSGMSQPPVGVANEVNSSSPPTQFMSYGGQ